MFQLDPTNNTDYNGNPYPFGMDPVSTILAREKMWPSNCNFAKVRKLHSKIEYVSWQFIFTFILFFIFLFFCRFGSFLLTKSPSWIPSR